MKLVESNGPKYTVELTHPDTGWEYHTFFSDVDEPWIDEELDKYFAELVVEAWNKFNCSGYYHEMSIVAEYIVGSTVYTKHIFAGGIYDVLEMKERMAA